MNRIEEIKESVQNLKSVLSDKVNEFLDKNKDIELKDIEIKISTIKGLQGLSFEEYKYKEVEGVYFTIKI